MYTVFFERLNGLNGEYVRIGETDTPDNAMRDCISQFLAERGYRPPYVRTWACGENLEGRKFDVGSHTEFFVVLPEDYNERKE